MEIQFVTGEMWLNNLFKAIDDVIEDEGRRENIKRYFDLKGRPLFNESELSCFAGVAAAFIDGDFTAGTNILCTENLLHILEQLVAIELLNEMKSLDMDFKRIALFYDSVEKAIEHGQVFYDD